MRCSRSRQNRRFIAQARKHFLMVVGLMTFFQMAVKRLLKLFLHPATKLVASAGGTDLSGRARLAVSAKLNATSLHWALGNAKNAPNLGAYAFFLLRPMRFFSLVTYSTTWTLKNWLICSSTDPIRRASPESPTQLHRVQTNRHRQQATFSRHPALGKGIIIHRHLSLRNVLPLISDF